MNEHKPREWIIRGKEYPIWDKGDGSYLGQRNTNEVSGLVLKSKEEIKVIEKSAYDQIEKERDSYKASSKHQFDVNSSLIKEIQKLKEENEELKAERDSWKESYEALEWTNK